MPGLVYLLFFCSGLSGLVYQVIWVRAFGNVFGNTIQSASLVVAVFMLGLGAGSYLFGRWADRWRQEARGSLLRVYGLIELVVAALGLGISLVLPHLSLVSRWVSVYVRDAGGWWVFSPLSHAGLVLVALALLLPITVLMGGTLTLLIRHLLPGHPDGWPIAVLYGVNTAGAAAGCFLTDFWFVPAFGLFRTQMLAVGVNAAIGGLALMAARASAAPVPARRRQVPPGAEPVVAPEPAAALVPLTALAVAISGFAAVGLEIVWFRHVAILLGAFRAVFSLLLTVILVGMGAGSLVAALVQRTAWWPRGRARAARWLMVVQGALAATTLAGAASVNVASIDAALAAADRSASGPAGATSELWFNVLPILIEAGLPALLMGFGFPLANAVIQRAETSVGRRAGTLYFANTAGSVAGSLAAGFILLPVLGLQASLAALAAVAATAAIPLFLAARLDPDVPAAAEPSFAASPLAALAASLMLAGVALGWWVRLPGDAIIGRALPPLIAGETRLALAEGFTEVIAVTDVASRGRRLLTNGHPMSATWPLSQRYMRALAHVPLLSMPAPSSALVIGFGVGNTTHAVTLHPSIARVEVADLSRDVLEHAEYFAAANQRVLRDPRVQVFINDGRHHLLMREPASFDLITLEPPPIAYAGTAALYSREFYQLARTRLTAGGFLSQWLPVYQVPGRSSLAMIRAFVDVFPQAVLLSGAGTDLLLVGTTGSALQIDPAELQERLQARPAVLEDLRRLNLATVPELVGTFVGSAATLAEGTRGVAPAVDDRPVQEYGVRSLFSPDTSGLSAVTDLARARDWCPRCYADGQPTGPAEGLDVYLSLLGTAYSAPPADFVRVRDLPPGQRVLAGSPYLGAVLPESPAVYNLIGVADASRGALEQAVGAFRQALALAPDFPDTHWHLGVALASLGSTNEALGHLRRAATLSPANGQARHDLGRLLAQTGALAESEGHLAAAGELLPESPEVQNDLGAVLARQGRLAEAVARFTRALVLRPGDPDAMRNLAVASR